MSILSEAPIFAYVPISDLDRGRHFYEDVLGQKAQSEVPNVGVTYECGSGTAFFMYLSKGAGTSKASCAFWTVEEIEAAVADLKRRGVVFEEYDIPHMKTENSIFEGGGAKAAWFKDPDGNILALIQPLHP